MLVTLPSAVEVNKVGTTWREMPPTTQEPVRLITSDKHFHGRVKYLIWAHIYQPSPVWGILEDTKLIKR